MNEIQDVTKTASIRFDKVSTEILRNIHPLMREAMINIGVRMVADTSIYKKYMNSEIKFNINEPAEGIDGIDVIESLSELNPQVPMTNKPNIPQSNNTSSTTVSPKANEEEKATTWDDF